MLFRRGGGPIQGALQIPVFGLGRLRTLAVMERAVGRGIIDLISLSRPLVREPDLIRRFQEGEAVRSECISCNKCLNPRGISCGDLTIARRRKSSRLPIETKPPYE
jgi:2,4-dienoyl-CoA reductase-like NADH-dependent reductase (Old Yellow Enzyme family)